MQWAGFAYHCLRERGNAPELRERAHAENHGARSSGNNRGAGKNKIGALNLRQARPPRGGSRLAGGHGFAGKRAVVYAQPKLFHHARVGGNVVALGQHNHIAGAQVARRDLLLRTAAFHARKSRQQLAQRVNSALGAVALPEGEGFVHHNNGPHDGSAAGLAAQQGDQAGSQQQNGHGVAQLQQQTLPKRRGTHRPQFVAAVEFTAGSSLCGQQAGGCAIQRGENFRDL